MKRVDCLVVGQGIAGLLTTFYLLQSGRSVGVFDLSEGNASKLSGAVLNPINLKNGHPAFSENTLSIAIKSYRDLERQLHLPLLSSKKLIRVTGSDQGQLPWLSPLSKETLPQVQSCFSNHSRFQETEVWHLDNRALLLAWENYRTPALIREKGQFVSQKCSLNNGEIRYGNFLAKVLIFCEGAAGRNNPFFAPLPFTRNRGDVLFLSIPGLPDSFLYQLTHRLIPLGKSLFWLGSNYQWNFNDLQPDKNWQLNATHALKKQLTLPFSLVAHQVAERPTTAGQQPLLLRHPSYKQIYFLNGLGTKGFSLAPVYCRQLLKQITSAASSTDNS